MDKKLKTIDLLEELQSYANRIVSFDDGLTTANKQKNYEAYLDKFSKLEDFAWEKGFKLNAPQLTGKKLDDIAAILIFCTDLHEVLEKEKPLRKFGLDHNVKELRDQKRKLIRPIELNDRAYVQLLINQIREVLQTSCYFGEFHQVRLLKRLEKLQKSLHISTSFFEYLI